MKTSPRAIAIAATMLAASGQPDAAQAQASTYPVRPVRFILPFPPGGGTDILGRILAQELGRGLGQQVVVDNRPGAGANIGAEIAARSAPDGYTLFMGNVAHAVNATLYRKLPYDFVRDFAPVTMLASTPNLLVAHPSVNARTVQELVGLAKASPGKLIYASSGSGSSAHLAGELFKSLAGVDLVHVPYKGGGPAVTALLAGEVAVGFATTPSVINHVKGGKLRALGVSTAKRSPATPDVPTIAEAGIAGYEAFTWYCLQVPQGTPKEIVARLLAEAHRTLAAAEPRERFAASGFEPQASTPEALGTFIRAEVAKWGKIVQSAGLRTD